MNGSTGPIDTLLLPIAKLVEAYARWSSRSSFNIPEPVDGDSAGKPLVLLVTGSMIVSDFFDSLAARLTSEGFRVVVFQPDDLLTVSLEKSAHDIDRALSALCSPRPERRSCCCSRSATAGWRPGTG